VTYYVKLLGSTDMPMPNDPWGRDPEMAKEVRFPAKPAPTDIAKGDELIYYAVGGYKRLFGASRVDDVPVINNEHSNAVVAKRWPYAAPVEVRHDVKLTYVSSGPSLDDVTPGLQKNVRHGVSHFEIGRPEFERAISLLRKAKSEEDQRLKRGWRP
jgi:hypothetical protein